MSTDDIGRDSSRGHYSIAMLAPPWAPITSESRDVERAIGLLCAGLVERGHRVTLFAAPGTRCSATVHEIVPLGALDPEAIVTPGIFVSRLVRIDRTATQAGGFKQAA